MLLCGNFNRDVALIGRHLDGIHNPPNIKDIIWEKFTKRNGFKYIPHFQDKVGKITLPPV
jgi:hypothetical protein